LPYQTFKRYFLVDAILASDVHLIILGTDGQTLLPIFAGQVISLLQLMFSFDHNFSLECGKEFIIVDRD